MNVLGIAWHDRQNIGDAMSSPLLYFDFGGADTEVVRPGDRPTRQPNLVIVGGGALVSGIPGIARKFRDAKKVAWGVGFTIRNQLRTHHARGSQFAHAAASVDLFGHRDWGMTDGEWVPCASCMHPAFNDPPAPTRPIVFYGHGQLNPLDGYGPHLTNACMDMGEVIAFLASGAIVVTGSYHGMYWATLLGRQVIVEPFGSKFYHHRYPQPLVHDWPNGLTDTRTYPNALEECRAANRGFYEKVMSL